MVTLTTPEGVTDVTGSAIPPRTLAVTDSSSTTTITGWSATGLPPGLSIDPTTGAVTGTPTTAGNYYAVTVSATDGAGFSGSTHFAWDVTNLVTVAPIADQSAHTSYAVAPVTPSATDSQVTPAVTLTWSATGLPPGIAVDHGTGTLSGAPTAPGTYPVTVTATDSATPHQSGSTTFTWSVTTLAPVVTGVTPTSGPGTGGTTVKIAGTDFQGTTAVDFGTVPASVSNVNAAGTLLTVTSPAHTTGAVDITVTARGGTSSDGTADRFTYLGPSISAISPASGPAVGGKKIKITGTALTGATSVTFGAVAATGVKVNHAGTQVTAIVPAGTPGSVVITVTTPGGTTAPGPADTYTYLGPAVTGVSPAAGPAAGGTRVTIEGSGFTGATTVSFGATPVTTFTVNKAGTTIKVVAPPGVAGAVDITVTIPGTTSSPVAADRFTYA